MLYKWTKSAPACTCLFPLMQHLLLHLSPARQPLSTSPRPLRTGTARSLKPSRLHGWSNGDKRKAGDKRKSTPWRSLTVQMEMKKHAIVACSRQNNCRHLAWLMEAVNDLVEETYTRVEIYNIYCNSHE